MNSLSVVELQAWLADPARPAPLLLDVREPWEHEFCALEGAVLVPLAYVPAQSATLDREREIVCICHHGVRSQRAAAYLAQQGFEKVYNLSGGVDAWARQIDPSMPTY
ncbi:rhodanese-like domain-containing protein [Uliginosibacterium sp. 31-16]|uniref:rhodanese-like domain-containing protein n=1 Tax=Uliginosibacterium sp. 31-16 TaxID=3068315 RepID=UPI00273E51F3|nr:rhodanese-like domain-containing protein [Uliginosibacterium sp. 31-16]MDP5238390.1 rhodanese-like domain-containing protein [Uliginosibacterium sp. 31-16]